MGSLDVPPRAQQQQQLPSWLPAEVVKLAPREREIAVMIYASRAHTAKQVEAQLSEPISNGAVRSMLGRLARKGIIARRPFGCYKTYAYFPVITNDSMRERALLQLTQDLFDGSLESLVRTMSRLIETRADAAMVIPFRRVR